MSGTSFIHSDANSLARFAVTAAAVTLGWLGNAHATPVEIDPFQIESADGGVGSNAIVYLVRADQLINLPLTDASGFHRYTGSGFYGFSWLDTASLRPESITIEYNHGVNCGLPINRTGFINGTAVGPVGTGDQLMCSESPVTTLYSYTFDTPESYLLGGTNRFQMGTALSSQGLSANPAWSMDGELVFGRVTLNYTLIPLPGAAWLFLSALCGLPLLRRRRLVGQMA